MYYWYIPLPLVFILEEHCSKFTIVYTKIGLTWMLYHYKYTGNIMYHWYIPLLLVFILEEYCKKFTIVYTKIGLTWLLYHYDHTGNHIL